MKKPNSVTTENNAQQSPQSTTVSTPEPTTVETPSSIISAVSSSPLQPQQNNSSWNNIGIALAVAASATIAGVIFVGKMTRKSVQ